MAPPICSTKLTRSLNDSDLLLYIASKLYLNLSIFFILHDLVKKEIKNANIMFQMMFQSLNTTYFTFVLFLKHIKKRPNSHFCE